MPPTSILSEHRTDWRPRPSVAGMPSIESVIAGILADERRRSRPAEYVVTRAVIHGLAFYLDRFGHIAFGQRASASGRLLGRTEIETRDAGHHYSLHCGAPKHGDWTLGVFRDFAGRLGIDASAL